MEAFALAQSNDPFQQELGFLRLEALREPATVSLIRPYADHRDPDLRAYAVRALAAVQGPEAVPLLLQKLKTDRSARVRGAAILGMEPYQSSSPMMLPALLKALRDRSPEVRITAIDVVSRIHDPRAREAILLRNKREHHQDVRRALGVAVPRVLGSHASTPSR